MSTLPATATNQDDMLAFVRAHKPALSFLLKLPPDQVLDSDLAILARYLVQESSRIRYEPDESVPHPLLDRIAALPPSQRSHAILLKALFRYDQSRTLYRPLPNVLRERPRFSPLVEKALGQRRLAHYRRGFRQLAGSVLRLNRHLDSLLTLLQSPPALDDPGKRRLVSDSLKTLRGDLRRCEWHCRAGCAWALASEFPADQVTRAMSRLYFQPMGRLAKSLTELDDHLAQFGIQGRLGPALNRANRRLFRELSEAYALQQSNRPAARLAGPRPR